MHFAAQAQACAFLHLRTSLHLAVDDDDNKSLLLSAGTMTDRSYRYPATGRSATFNNPARISLPSVGGYVPLYANDPDYVASPTRYAAAAATPRGYTTAAAAAGAVVPPPRSYSTVNPEPRAPRPPPPREQSRSRRSNTVDASARPPIIVTTMQDAHRPHTSSPHTTDALAHAGSPIRDAYRASEGRLYSQPASSIRSRSTARPYHTSTNSDDFGRSREQGEIVLASRDADAYRNSRPHVVYPSNSRHSNAAIDYGDEGYQYTNAGELVRYDLDHGVAPAPRHSRRHESFDRGYSRPNINYNADQRSFNVNTTMDPSRTSRPYDSRGGPPPSVRGFDKINRAYDTPPLAPAPPNSSSSGQLDLAGAPTDRRTVGRPRPVSLIQESGSRPEDYYRGYEDDEYDPRRFYDDSVPARGFGLRTAQTDDLQDHHERYWDPRDDREGSARRDPSRRRIEAPPKEGQRSHSDEERTSDREREDYYRGYKDNLRERLDGRRDEDPEDGDRSRARDKVAAAGAAVTAAAVAGAVSSSSKKEEKPEPSESRRRRGSDEAEERDRERERERERERDRERERERERDREREREQKRDEDKDRPVAKTDDAKADAETKDRSRRDAEAKANGDSAAIVSSDSDEGRKKSARNHRPSHSFNPYDTGDLRQIREQLAEGEKEKEKAEPNGKGRSSPPAKDDRRSESPSGEENRGRDLVVVRSPEEKQVRVVSPPHEKKEDKPLKGILKQPSAKFPEEPNPIREGVAPHKEDKKLKEVPSGARWTKINRKIVNPEALDIGKERYEIRDDFVIVLRVLSKEEIQTYANATQVLRGKTTNTTPRSWHSPHRDAVYL